MDNRQRIHGIDALRGVAMLLGIVLHATIAYKVVPLPTWPQDPLSHHWLFDYVYFFIHSFRMPLFFLIAGYFCRFLYYKTGEIGFIKHRAKRILVPFLASLLLVLPLTIFPFLVYHYSLIEPGQWDKIFNDAFKQLFHWNGMAHLWFLYYLLIYYVIVVVLMRIWKMPGIQKIVSGMTWKLNFLTGSYGGILLTGLPVSLVLIMVPELFLFVDTGLVPGLAYPLFFGVFFLLGWFTNKSGTVNFSWMVRNTWVLIGLGVGLSFFLFWLEFTGRYAPLTFRMAGLVKLVAAWQALLLVYGFTGFFLKYFHADNKAWKWVSDASYWMYLIHLALVAGLQILFLQIEMHAVIKFLLILLITMGVTLSTYHYWVRYSVLGEFLHGKRQKHPGRSPDKIPAL